MDIEECAAAATRVAVDMGNRPGALGAIEAAASTAQRQLSGLPGAVPAARVRLAPGDMTEYRYLIVAPEQLPHGPWLLLLENGPRVPLVPILWELHMAPDARDLVILHGWDREPWTAGVTALFLAALSVRLMGVTW